MKRTRWTSKARKNGRTIERRTRLARRERRKKITRKTRRVGRARKMKTRARREERD